MADETVNYRAVSAATDPITILNVLALALVNQDVRAVFPPSFIPYVTAIVALLNIFLRLLPNVADRPVRLSIAPGDSKTVQLTKLK